MQRLPLTQRKERNNKLYENIRKGMYNNWIQPKSIKRENSEVPSKTFVPVGILKRRRMSQGTF